MKESTYILARGYAMRLGRIFVHGCIGYALYSIATCSVCSSTSPKNEKAEQTTTNTKDNIETKLSENNRNKDNRNSDDDNDEDKLHQITKGISDRINYAVDNITDNVSGHIKKKADDATKPYIEPWKELGAEVSRYGLALKNDYLDGKVLRD